jgi:hypothetical protein
MKLWFLKNLRSLTLHFDLNREHANYFWGRKNYNFSWKIFKLPLGIQFFVINPGGLVSCFLCNKRQTVVVVVDENCFWMYRDLQNRDFGHFFFLLPIVNQSELSFGLIFLRFTGLFGWTNIEDNRTIQKLSYTLGFGSRRALRAEISLRKMTIAAVSLAPGIHQLWFLSGFAAFSDE